ncbi:MAG: hypothetical protein ACPGES_11065 [Coraliomargarita sp.]
MSEHNKLSLKQIILIGVFTGLGTVGGKFAYNYFTSGSIADQPTMDRVLVETANELNKNLPIVLDRHTRLDSTIAGSGKKFLYQYTMLNVDPAALNVAEFIREMKPKLIAQYQTRDEMKTFRDMGVELTYSYLSEAGVELVNIQISPQDFLPN